MTLTVLGEMHCRNSRREELMLLDRKSSMLTSELHDVRVQSEISEKARRAAEAEVKRASEIISQLTATNAALSISHKKIATEHEQLTVNTTLIIFLLFNDLGLSFVSVITKC